MLSESGCGALGQSLKMIKRQIARVPRKDGGNIGSQRLETIESETSAFRRHGLRLLDGEAGESPKVLRQGVVGQRDRHECQRIAHKECRLSHPRCSGHLFGPRITFKCRKFRGLWPAGRRWGHCFCRASPWDRASQ